MEVLDCRCGGTPEHRLTDIRESMSNGNAYVTCRNCGIGLSVQPKEMTDIEQRVGENGWDCISRRRHAAYREVIRRWNRIMCK